jgi:hypothetical protein
MQFSSLLLLLYPFSKKQGNLAQWYSIWDPTIVGSRTPGSHICNRPQDEQMEEFYHGKKTKSLSSRTCPTMHRLEF